VRLKFGGRMLTVSTTKELKDAYKKRVCEILVQGKLALKLHKIYQKKKPTKQKPAMGATTIGAAGISPDSIKAIVCLILAGTLAVVAIIAICKDYDEMEFDITAMTYPSN
jgi:hypothetical protein